MDKGTLSVLEADVCAQLAEIEGIYERIEEREEGFERDAMRLESLSCQLHNLFCAFEDLFEIIAAFFEHSISERSRWHIALLKRMREDIEGIRPALFHFQRKAGESIMIQEKLLQEEEDRLFRIKTILDSLCDRIRFGGLSRGEAERSACSVQVEDALFY